MISPSIGVITYNIPHRKTQDVLHGLKAKGYINVKVFAIPFTYRENPFQPIYQHRPNRVIKVELEEYCKNFNYDFVATPIEYLDDQLTTASLDFILIAGAGLLPERLVEKFKLINAHPGILPKVRGLDALKWAIINDIEVGVTSHFIDKEADAGLLINQKIVPIYKNDTFHSVAQRQYELEIEMLIETIEIIPKMTDFISLSSNEFEPKRRMPNHIEKDLLIHFERYKSKLQFD